MERGGTFISILFFNLVRRGRLSIDHFDLENCWISNCQTENTDSIHSFFGLHSRMHSIIKSKVIITYSRIPWICSNQGNLTVLTPISLRFRNQSLVLSIYFRRLTAKRTDKAWLLMKRGKVIPAFGPVSSLTCQPLWSYKHKNFPPVGK